MIPKIPAAVYTTSSLFTTSLMLVLATTMAPRAQALDIRILMQGDNPAQALRQRVRDGQPIEAMLRPGPGTLIDPATVAVTWNGEEIDFFMHLRIAGLALVLVPSHQFTAGGGKLTITARDASTGEEAPPLERSTLTLLLTEDDLASGRVAAHTRAGMKLHIVDPQQHPIAGASFFGQVRSDLLARSDDDGVVVADMPRRNPTSPHFAWAGGFHPSAAELLTTTTIVLQPIESPAVSARRLSIQPMVEDGATTPVLGIVCMEPDYYALWREGGAVELPAFAHHAEPETPILFITPGFRPSRMALGAALAGEPFLVQQPRREP